MVFISTMAAWRSLDSFAVRLMVDILYVVSALMSGLWWAARWKGTKIAQTWSTIWVLCRDEVTLQRDICCFLEAEVSKCLEVVLWKIEISGVVFCCWRKRIAEWERSQSTFKSTKAARQNPKASYEKWILRRIRKKRKKGSYWMSSIDGLKLLSCSCVVQAKVRVIFDSSTPNRSTPFNDVVCYILVVIAHGQSQPTEIQDSFLEVACLYYYSYLAHHLWLWDIHYGKQVAKLINCTNKGRQS